MAARKQAAKKPTGLQEGAQAPAFELLDDAGKAFSSADLAGKAYVLWFYPKADTPG